MRAVHPQRQEWRNKAIAPDELMRRSRPIADLDQPKALND
jgi:hypothetical protein